MYLNCDAIIIATYNSQCYITKYICMTLYLPIAKLKLNNFKYFVKYKRTKSELFAAECFIVL